MILSSTCFQTNLSSRPAGGIDGANSCSQLRRKSKVEKKIKIECFANSRRRVWKKLGILRAQSTRTVTS